MTPTPADPSAREAGSAVAEPALLRVGGARKSFPGVDAVRSVDLEVRAGEVLALVGENGAGKSTLIKMITGAHRPDAGRILLDGRELAGLSPAATARAGVAVIYQELSLIPQLTVRENLFLGRERARRGLVDAGAERARARGILARLGLDVDLEARAGDLDVARRQLVEIARALLVEARLLIMDEPTAALAPREVDALFGVLAALRRDGLAILFISHRLDEVFALADRIAVMRDGEMLGVWPAAGLERRRLIELMVGRSLDREFPLRRAAPGEELLAVRDLSGGRVRGVSFAVREGEIVGLAGLMGAGRTDLAHLLFGAEPRAGGEILLGGRPVRWRGPHDAIAAGVALLTEDRKGQGLVLGLAARDNFSLPNLDRFSRGGWIDRHVEDAAFGRFVAGLGIRLAGPEQPAGELSGGNQQKLLVARWLERDARLVIFDEPTRGVDVGAKYEIYQLMHDLAARGKAVLMISSELPEILGMSDRVLVMREGRLAGEVGDVRAATQESLLALAVAGGGSESGSADGGAGADAGADANADVHADDEEER